MKKFIKNLIIGLFGIKFFLFLGVIIKNKFKPYYWISVLHLVKLKEDLIHNESLLNKLNLDKEKIKSILANHNIDYYSHHQSWHYHIFTGLSNNNPINILEIGTHKANFTYYLSYIFPNSKITTIDLPDDNLQFINSYNRSDKKIYEQYVNSRKKNLNRKNITFLQFKSSFLSSKFSPETFDIIWIDGAHLDPDVSEDINHSINLCKKGGIICVDDVITGNFKNAYVSKDSYVTLEKLSNTNVLKSHYFNKRINVDNFFKDRKKYISFSIKK